MTEQTPTPVVDPPAEAPKKGGAPVRDYVVFEEVTFEGDEEVYYTTRGTVPARNSQNALRKAARERGLADGDEEAEPVLSVVPKSMWRPTKVSMRRDERVSVSIGG